MNRIPYIHETDLMHLIKRRLLPPFLVFSGVVCLSAYPLMWLWPSGWEWGMEGRHYLHMILVVYATLGVFLILAARNPPAYRSLLLFTAWSSLAHGGLMAVQALVLHQYGHLAGDVPAMLVLGAGLAWLMPRKTAVTT
ncbi:MAG: DUF6632 domain-containing protein [Moraxellaceae bacterium]|nr:DUF6632 domain-containing protein [Moraxellaceae bacterium]MDZ4386332.1 DUF6632 domain-containing protein [Moraxellaceae bacterium]